MYLANPWGLLGLLALPLIVVIHLYHRRYPALFVAGLHLWGVETHTTTAGRTRERLPITPSLICELLAALLLALVLSDPRWGDVGKVVHLVVVLDNSASMSSRPPGLEEKSFRDAALIELDRRVQRLPRGSVVTLLRTGRRPEMLAGPAVSWVEAKPLLDDWRPALPRHDFKATWDLASQLAAETGQLLFLTDKVPDDKVAVPQLMEVVSVGRALENVSISAARWDFDSRTAKGRVFLRLTNHGQRAANVRVAGTVGEQSIFQQTNSLAVGATAPLEVEVPGGLGRLVIKTETIGDGLPLDDRIELIEPKVRTLHVAVALPKESAALKAVQRALRGVPDVSLSDAESAELIIAPAQPSPPSRRELWWLGIGPFDPSEAARKAATDLSGPYILEKQNPLLDGLTLSGVVWGGVQPMPLDVAPIITAGQYPLLSRLNGTRTAAYLLNLDFARTNLAESPDWPILLSNLIELRRDNLPGLRRWNYRLNEEIHFRLIEDALPEASNSAGASESAEPIRPRSGERGDSAGRSLLLVHGNQKRPLARATIVEVPPLDEVAVYTILDGDRPLGEFAVNFFDSDESTLTGLRPGHRDPAEESSSFGGFQIDQPLTWMILVGIALTLVAAFADWQVLRPVGRRS
ncbi:MAG: hypothetical protein ACKV2Q_03625 [Planctomycetaceae bacterium]